MSVHERFVTKDNAALEIKEMMKILNSMSKGLRWNYDFEYW